MSQQDNTTDLGSSSIEFKDIYIDGTANLDAVDIDGGVVDGWYFNWSTLNIDNSNGAFTNWYSFWYIICNWRLQHNLTVICQVQVLFLVLMQI